MDFCGSTSLDAPLMRIFHIGSKFAPENSVWLNFSQRSVINWRDFCQSNTYNSCKDHFRLQFFCWSKWSIFTSQYSSKLFFSIKRFSTVIFFQTEDLSNFLTIQTFFFINYKTSNIISKITKRRFALFYFPFPRKKRYAIHRANWDFPLSA